MLQAMQRARALSFAHREMCEIAGERRRRVTNDVVSLHPLTRHQTSMQQQQAPGHHRCMHGGDSMSKGLAPRVGAGGSDELCWQLERARQLSRIFANTTYYAQQQQQQQQSAAFMQQAEASPQRASPVNLPRPELEIECAVPLGTFGTSRPPSPPMPPRPPAVSSQTQQMHFQERLEHDTWELVFCHVLELEDWSWEAELCLKLVSKHASLPVTRAASYRPGRLTSACNLQNVHRVLQTNLTERDIGNLACVCHRLNKAFRPRRRIVELLRRRWLNRAVDMYWHGDDRVYTGHVVRVYDHGVRLRARVQFDEPVGNVRGVAVCHHTFTFFELNELN